MLAHKGKGLSEGFFILTATLGVSSCTLAVLLSLDSPAGCGSEDARPLPGSHRLPLKNRCSCSLALQLLFCLSRFLGGFSEAPWYLSES